MRQFKASLIALALGAGVATMGCSSSSSSDDGSADSAISTDSGANTDTGGNADTADALQLFGLTTGDSCFDIVSAEAGTDDGCMLNVAVDAPTGLVGGALPVNYVMATGVVTVGDGGSLGAGAVARNQGTLTRDGTTSDTSTPACTWHQIDTSMLTLTATNQFTLAVTEVENMFATACGAGATPTGGTCTSTWTWTMKKSTTKTPPSCQ